MVHCERIRSTKAKIVPIDDTQVAQMETPDESLEVEESLSKCIRQLAEVDIMIVQWHAEGITAIEIAKRINKSRNYVGPQLQRIKHRLRLCLTREGILQ